MDTQLLMQILTSVDSTANYEDKDSIHMTVPTNTTMRDECHTILQSPEWMKWFAYNEKQATMSEYEIPTVLAKTDIDIIITLLKIYTHHPDIQAVMIDHILEILQTTNFTPNYANKHFLNSIGCTNTSIRNECHRILESPEWMQCLTDNEIPSQTDNNMSTTLINTWPPAIQARMIQRILRATILRNEIVRGYLQTDCYYVHALYNVEGERIDQMLTAKRRSLILGTGGDALQASSLFPRDSYDVMHYACRILSSANASDLVHNEAYNAVFDFVREQYEYILYIHDTTQGVFEWQVAFVDVCTNILCQIFTDKCNCIGRKKKEMPTHLVVCATVMLRDLLNMLTDVETCPPEFEGALLRNCSSLYPKITEALHACMCTQYSNIPVQMDMKGLIGSYVTLLQFIRNNNLTFVVDNIGEQLASLEKVARQNIQAHERGQPNAALLDSMVFLKNVYQFRKQYDLDHIDSARQMVPTITGIILGDHQSPNQRHRTIALLNDRAHVVATRLMMLDPSSTLWGVRIHEIRQACLGAQLVNPLQCYSSPRACSSALQNALAVVEYSRPGFEKSHREQGHWPRLTAEAHEAGLLELDNLALSIRKDLYVDTPLQAMRMQELIPIVFECLCLFVDPVCDAPTEEQQGLCAYIVTQCLQHRNLGNLFDVAACAASGGDEAVLVDRISLIDGRKYDKQQDLMHFTNFLYCICAPKWKSSPHTMAQLSTTRALQVLMLAIYINCSKLQMPPKDPVQYVFGLYTPVRWNTEQTAFKAMHTMLEIFSAVPSAISTSVSVVSTTTRDSSILSRLQNTAQHRLNPLTCTHEITAYYEGRFDVTRQSFSSSVPVTLCPDGLQVIHHCVTRINRAWIHSWLNHEFKRGRIDGRHNEIAQLKTVLDDRNDGGENLRANPNMPHIMRDMLDP